jgi:hypothetical protein
VFPLIQAAVQPWQDDGTTAEQIAAGMAAAPSMSGQGTMGDENTPDAVAATGVALSLLDPSVFDPVLSGEGLTSYDPTVPIPVPGTLLQPDRELGAAFFDEHVPLPAASSPEIDVVRVTGVGHLVHDSVTHRDRYVAELHRLLDTYAPA